jgi:Zn-dependent protease
MSFRLFGVNVEIQMGFWINALVIGYLSVPARGPKGDKDFRELLRWIPIMLLSILVHEYGHAFAIMRHGIEPEITLHSMGGRTSWRQVLPLSRPQHIVISLAGPFAGFLLAGAIFAFMMLLPGVYHRLPYYVSLAIQITVLINVVWGIFNLIPVLPLDGGHVLQHALGPKRLKLTATISLVLAAGGALYFALSGSYFAALIFGLSAYQSFQLLQVESAAPDLSEQRSAAPREPPVPGEILAKLRSARRALAEDDYAVAAGLANEAIRLAGEQETPLPSVKVEAYEVLGWAAQLRGDPEEAARWIKAAQHHGSPDVALVAAVLISRGDTRDARRVLEQARASGDDRKEIVGPLIQILIAEGEVARAAAVAFDIVESLSDEDARKMAQIAFGARSFDWSARLYEAIFARGHLADDAYEAARAFSAEGAHDRALDMLARAVSAGFSDRARAWSDAAFEPLRSGHKLENVVPPP